MELIVRSSSRTIMPKLPKLDAPRDPGKENVVSPPNTPLLLRAVDSCNLDLVVIEYIVQIGVEFRRSRGRSRSISLESDDVSLKSPGGPIPPISPDDCDPETALSAESYSVPFGAALVAALSITFVRDGDSDLPAQGVVSESRTRVCEQLVQLGRFLTAVSEMDSRVSGRRAESGD